MRRLVAVLLAAALVALLVGCGGGEEAETPPAGEPAPGMEAAPSVEPTEVVDFSDPEPAITFEPFPPQASPPTKLAADIEARQPTLILFVDGAQKVTDEVRSAVNKAMAANRGLVSLHVYDVGKYTSVDASGVARVDTSGLKKDTTAAKAAMFARDIGVATTPYIIMTDDQGFIVFRHSSLVDATFLAMHMERLAK